MNKPIYTEEYKGYTIKIYYDKDCGSPMEYEETFKLYMPHRRYNLGNTDEEPESLVFMLPIYMYDHGGITINTTGFSCPWDSGQVGVIYINRDEALSIWKDEEAVEEAMRGCISNYDDYLQGNCYGYMIEFNDEQEESCWGFIGDYECCLKEARGAVDGLEPVHEQTEMELNK